MIDAVNSIGVIGAGQMGRGIAQVAAVSGYDVILHDVGADILKNAFDFIHKQLEKSVEKQKLDQKLAKEAFKRLARTSNLDSLHNCDLIIEAATENKKIKFELFAKLDKLVKPEAILASNTSSISITEIGAVTKRAQQVVGMHFMNPVPIMKLVEGIRGLQTSDLSFETVANVAQKMGKVFVRVADIPGFAVNRILMPMINEAIYTVFEGIASIQDIDQAMKLGTNQPMGPLELADFIGLDTCLSIMNVIHEGIGDPKYRPCPLLKNYVAAGLLGRKTGRGFYEY